MARGLFCDLCHFSIAFVSDSKWGNAIILSLWLGEFVGGKCLTLCLHNHSEIWCQKLFLLNSFMKFTDLQRNNCTMFISAEHIHQRNPVLDESAHLPLPVCVTVLLSFSEVIFKPLLYGLKMTISRLMLNPYSFFTYLRKGQQLVSVFTTIFIQK